jgi:hypothetical protein
MQRNAGTKGAVVGLDEQRMRVGIRIVDFLFHGVRLDYSCHHFAQTGDVDLQIITEHENEQIDAAEEVVQGVVEAGLPQQYPQAPLWDVETIQGLYSP